MTAGAGAMYRSTATLSAWPREASCSVAVTLGRAELPEEDFSQDWTAELPDWVVDAIRLDVSMHPRKARSPSRLLEGIAWEVTTAACRAKVPLADLVYKSDTREVGIGNGQYRKAEP